MSYFPNGDHTNTYNSAPFAPAAFDFAPTHEQDDWNTIYSTGVCGVAAQHPPPFKITNSLGLGLFTLPVSSAQAYFELGVEHDRSNSVAPTFWPSQYSAIRTHIAHPQPTRASSWNNFSFDREPSYNGQASWDSQQTSHAANPSFELTPVLSEYSVSTRPSAASTPCARSDSVIFPVDSPSIKIENRSRPSTPKASATTFHGLPMVVKPEDLICQPTQPIEEQLEACTVSTPSSEDGDTKGSIAIRPLVARPLRQRAFSSEDVLEDRKKRSYTSTARATCHCHICGKMFQRTYNLRAHLETHDPRRSHPHPCDYDDCDKRFVRRTDLVRHEQSVHLKERNHVCPLCSSSFARKDTLRRHVDDGCPRRLEVRKRGSKRRASSASVVKRSPQYKKEGSPASARFSWENIPEFD